MLRGSLDDLAAFSVVARHLSFTRAAAELGVATSSLSALIRKLEARLGIVLLRRSTRTVSLTDAGATLLAALDPALGRLDAVIDELRQERDLVTGTVRITTLRQAYESVLLPAMPAFRARYPDATVEVMIDYQLRDIVADGFDAGIRLGETLDQDVIAVNVSGPQEMAVVASPHYLADRSPPSEPHDLAAHDCINYRMRAGGDTMPWEFTRDERDLHVRVKGHLAFNEPQLMIQAACEGFGVAYVYLDQVRGELASGRLVRLLAEWTPPFPGFFLYYPSRRSVTPALAALIELLRARMVRHSVAKSPAEAWTLAMD